MTLAQKIIQKLSAFIAGCIVFAIIWLTMNPYTLILDLLDERTVVTALGTVATVLIADAVIGYAASIRQGKKKPRRVEEEAGSAYLCPNCGQTFAKPVNIMDPKTEKFLYSVCPKCAKPLIPQYIQPAQPQPPPPPPVASIPPMPPIPTVAPLPPRVDPAEIARSLGENPPEAPAAPKTAKPRLELKPDGTIIVYPGA